MKTTLSNTLKVGMVCGAVMLAPAAHAEGGRIAAGVAGGLLGGMLLGGALASGPVYAAPPPPPPAYYYPPSRVYVEEPECRLVRQQYWDGYGYRLRRVQVCN